MVPLASSAPPAGGSPSPAGGSTDAVDLAIARVRLLTSDLLRLVDEGQATPQGPRRMRRVDALPRHRHTVR